MNNIGKLVMEAVDQAFRDLGHATVIVAGTSGSGKSTLINTVFRKRMASTGVGEPVTQGTHTYSHEDMPITIIDTQGFETGSEGKAVYEDLKVYIEEKNTLADPNQHVHLAWLCIGEGSTRVNDTDKNFLALMDELDVPTVVVITKAMERNRKFKAEVERLLPTAKNWVWVIAQPYQIPAGDGAFEVAAHGLNDLLDISYRLIPEGQRTALVSANRINISQKLNRSHAVVAASAATAGGVGAVPIPFSDAAVLIPTQIAMLASISIIWGLSTDKAFLGTLLAGTLSGSAGTWAGRTAVANFFKLIPGAGSIVGGTISATTAALITTVFGEAYVAALHQLLKDDPDRNLSPTEITQAFKQNLAKQSPLNG